MTADEILKAVLAMTPKELTAKVAEHRGIHPVMMTRDASRICHWEDDEDTIVELGDWSPPKLIEDAWPLWEELAERFPHDIKLVGQPNGVVFIMIGLPVYTDSYGDFAKAPLAITKAWVWWNWSEKEKSDEQDE